MGESSACELLLKIFTSSSLWGLRCCSCSCNLLPSRPSLLEQPEWVVMVQEWMGGTTAHRRARGPAQPAQGLVETGRTRSHMDPCGARPAIAAGLV